MDEFRALPIVPLVTGVASSPAKSTIYMPIKATMLTSATQQVMTKHYLFESKINVLADIILDPKLCGPYVDEVIFVLTHLLRLFIPKPDVIVAKHILPLYESNVKDPNVSLEDHLDHVLYMHDVVTSLSEATLAELASRMPLLDKLGKFHVVCNMYISDDYDIDALELRKDPNARICTGMLVSSRCCPRVRHRLCVANCLVCLLALNSRGDASRSRPHDIGHVCSDACAHVV